MTRDVVIDRASLLVEVSASVPLDVLEEALTAAGFTLGQAVASSTSLGEWLAAGAPGAASAFADPADHLVAGLEGKVNGKRALVIRPGPRRAVGPDLAALVLGAHGRFATIDRVWLRIHPRGARRQALPLPDGVDLDPPVGEGEARLLAAIERELR